VIRLGDVEVHLLDDGRFALDGGAMYGVVPRARWEKHDPPDEKNRVALGLNVALVITAGRKLLVDTGLGDKWSDKQRAMYRIERASTLLESLRRLGYGPEDIDVVVNTHLHFDHAGGNTMLKDGKVVPTFPRARYVVQMGEWEDATHPNERNRASYLEPDFVPLAEARQLETVQGQAEVAPGVHVVPVGGHTAYHQMVIVEGGRQALVIPTDLVPTAAHLPLPYIMGYDLFPVGTLEAKRRVLKDAAERGSTLLFYHDVKTPLAKIKLEKDRYVLAGATA
jgi:glyoxylase-like metal-dependent hydrolase (beta-lactamase superfamily II)